MKSRLNRFVLIAAVGLICLFVIQVFAAEEVVRPTEIKSKRLVIYDQETYQKLAQMWKDYNDKFPSEYAYANWMYASRYAGVENYTDLLESGLKKYPANPTLLYLKSLTVIGPKENPEERKYLERAVALDPNYMDPWFSLVIIYMETNDEERLNLALKKLLESGIIYDEVLDYNYNLISSLDSNAILITNGDNDTYPGWILTKALGIRSDVSIVNRSMLNTDWYPAYLIGKGVPRFISEKELKDLRDKKLNDKKANKADNPSGLFGDTLIVRIISAAKQANRPVYFSKTLYYSDKLREIEKNGYDLGLVTLVTPGSESYGKALKKTFNYWLEKFRTGGLSSWRLRQSPEADAGKSLVVNYAFAIAMELDSLKKYAPELRGRLFNWYTEYVEPAISTEYRGSIAPIWCRQNDIKEIDTWCKRQGIGR